MSRYLIVAAHLADSDSVDPTDLDRIGAALAPFKAEGTTGSIVAIPIPQDRLPQALREFGLDVVAKQVEP